MEHTLISINRAQTEAYGAALGAILAAGDVVALVGDFGAGKTAFTSGLARGWGALEMVNSPSFVIIHQHTRRKDAQRLHHLDCYRLRGALEAESIGVADLLESHDVVVIEWADMIGPLIPPHALWIAFEVSDDPYDGAETRVLRFEWPDEDPRWQSALEAL
jgi:tRNA threonylcarbamoyladenosine biosynthesis protein TsaE